MTEISGASIESVSHETCLRAATIETEHAADPTDFRERLSLFARLENIRRELDDTLARVKRHIDGMRSALHEEMAEQGMESARVHGLSVHPRTDLTVNKLSNESGVTAQMVCDALTEIGREDMVNDGYSGASLKSLIREMLDNEQDVPECLNKLLYIERITKLVTTKT